MADTAENALPLLIVVYHELDRAWRQFRAGDEVRDVAELHRLGDDGAGFALAAAIGKIGDPALRIVMVFPMTTGRWWRSVIER